jgi:cold shock CspA family protein
MRLTGIVKAWDAKAWLGTIESGGKSYIVRRHNFKRGTVLAEGQTVTFIPVNLLEGPTAQNVKVLPQ